MHLVGLYIYIYIYIYIAYRVDENNALKLRNRVMYGTLNCIDLPLCRRLRFPASPLCFTQPLTVVTFVFLSCQQINQLLATPQSLKLSHSVATPREGSFRKECVRWKWTSTVKWPQSKTCNTCWGYCDLTRNKKWNNLKKERQLRALRRLETGELFQGI